MRFNLAIYTIYVPFYIGVDDIKTECVKEIYLINCLLVSRASLLT